MKSDLILTTAITAALNGLSVLVICGEAAHRRYWFQRLEKMLAELAPAAGPFHSNSCDCSIIFPHTEGRIIVAPRGEDHTGFSFEVILAQRILVNSEGPFSTPVLFS